MKCDSPCPIPARPDLLIVDDEAPARQRLCDLLGDLSTAFPQGTITTADNGLAALAHVNQQPTAIVLADIRMPGMDGLELASHLARLPNPPAVIFTTAYDNHAVQAFELNAIDYLLKPVRAQRLLTALQKARPPDASAPDALQHLGQSLRGGPRRHLACHERGRLLLVPIEAVLYLRAELKYVTARTVDREFLLDESLTQLESELGERFLRLHRAVLIAHHALAGLEKHHDEEADAYGWALVRGVPEKLPISRRQWPLVKAIITARNP